MWRRKGVMLFQLKAFFFPLTHKALDKIIMPGTYEWMCEFMHCMVLWEDCCSLHHSKQLFLFQKNIRFYGILWISGVIFGRKRSTQLHGVVCCVASDIFFFNNFHLKISTLEPRASMKPTLHKKVSIPHLWVVLIESPFVQGKHNLTGLSASDAELLVCVILKQHIYSWLNQLCRAL